jgi:hypothetical protein
MVALASHTRSGFADNKLQLKRSSDEVLMLELSNSDPIAGFQFSINARGGITLRSWEGGNRTNAAGFSIYQYLADDSTLNVVMLAPYRMSLPTGEGVLGQIPFTLTETSGADTVRVFLSRVVICNVDAKYLAVTTTELCWSAGTSVENQSAHFNLEQNFPNPFNPSTTIVYTLQKPGSVRLVVFDITGRSVNTLVNQSQSAGRYVVKWNVNETGSMKLPSGVYFARLGVGGHAEVLKMILAK